MRSSSPMKQGGRSEVERLDSTDAPLGLHRLHPDRRRQLCGPGDAEGRNASPVGDLLAATPARPALVHGPVLVRSAVRRPPAEQPYAFEDDHMKTSDARQDWRGETLSRMRRLIKAAAPDVVEEVKWVKATNPGVPTWSHNGIICTGETYKSVVKLTFAKGASLKDPARLFNSSLDGKVRRA